MSKRPLVLLILDGWGLRPAQETYGNPIAELDPPFYKHLLATYPWCALDASGLAVGLPEGQMGNSEVGHLNMGAGRVVFQELTLIDQAINNESFYQNPVLLDAFSHVEKTGGTVHIMGLLSDGGVHSHIGHWFAMLDLAQEQCELRQIDQQRVRCHVFTDGRDVPPKSGLMFAETLESALDTMGFPQVASVSGRYYAMDRDNRWERIEAAYTAIVSGQGTRQPLSTHAIERAYLEDITDEFIKPSLTDFTYHGMADGDAIVFVNFRPDRARQLTRAFVDANFSAFERCNVLKNLYFAGMSTYDKALPIPTAYPKPSFNNMLAEVLSRHGMRQFRCAETEKYAHVTFFFNGGVEQPYPLEYRLLVPSPKVATYDGQPQMSLPHVTQALVGAIQSQQYEVLIANFANPDMVGHTGNLPAAVEAVTAIDDALKQVTEAVLAQNGVLLITADHGNIETMIDPETGCQHTAHTTALVPFIVVSPPESPVTLVPSSLAPLSSVAPSMLALLGLPIPAEMTTPSLIVCEKPCL